MSDSSEQSAAGGNTDAQRPSRQLLIRANLRALATSSVLVALYFLLPMDGSGGASSTVVKLMLGLVVFTAVVFWSVRRIVDSDNPGLKAYESLFVALPLFLLLFSAAYVQMSQADDASFTETLSRTDALYFTITIFSTVGFGDISPATGTTRLVVAAQMLLDLVVLGLGVRLIVTAVQRGRDRLTE
jgi:voltage-gated potassium channel